MIVNTVIQKKKKRQICHTYKTITQSSFEPPFVRTPTSTQGSSSFWCSPIADRYGPRSWAALCVYKHAVQLGPAPFSQHLNDSSRNQWLPQLPEFLWQEERADHKRTPGIRTSCWPIRNLVYIFHKPKRQSDWLLKFYSSGYSGLVISTAASHWGPCF